MATLCAKRTSAPRADEKSYLRVTWWPWDVREKRRRAFAPAFLEYVDRIVYWALADVTREAPRLGPSTTTSAPIFTRL
jgi:hypothetical protein